MAEHIHPLDEDAGCPRCDEISRAQRDVIDTMRLVQRAHRLTVAELQQLMLETIVDSFEPSDEDDLISAKIREQLARAIYRRCPLEPDDLVFEGTRRSPFWPPI
jgi:hypothetical protein